MSGTHDQKVSVVSVFMALSMSAWLTGAVDEVPEDVQEAEDFWVAALEGGGRMNLLDDGRWLLLSVDAPAVPDPEPEAPATVTVTETATTTATGTTDPEPTAPTTDPGTSGPAAPTATGAPTGPRRCPVERPAFDRHAVLR